MTQRRGLTALLRAGDVNCAKAAKRVLATRGGQLHGAGCALSAGLMLQATVSLLVPNGGLQQRQACQRQGARERA